MLEQEALQGEIDKTLFDFDDEIDQLSQVSERYQVKPPEEPLPQVVSEKIII